MTAPDIDPIVVAADWLPRLPTAARGMVATLCVHLERERAQHAVTRAELDRAQVLLAVCRLRAEDDAQAAVEPAPVPVRLVVDPEPGVTTP